MSSKEIIGKKGESLDLKTLSAGDILKIVFGNPFSFITLVVVEPPIEGNGEALLAKVEEDFISAKYRKGLGRSEHSSMVGYFLKVYREESYRFNPYIGVVSRRPYEFRISVGTHLSLESFNPEKGRKHARHEMETPVLSFEIIRRRK